MRVGLVCPYDLGLPGGVQKVVVELARHLQDGGDDVLVVGPGAPPRGSAVSFISVGGSMRVPANRSIAPIALNPFAWARTRLALDNLDIVHIHEPFVPLTGWAAALWRSHPTVVTFHADAPRWAQGLYRLLGSVARRALGEVTTTAVSPVAASAVPRSWAVPRIIPNAIDVDSYGMNVDRRVNQVAFLGRDEPRKGLSVLLDAWPSVVESHPGAELAVMGASRDVSIPGVTFHGPTGEQRKREILISSQVLVAPNLGGESFGVVLIEGMASGCAVVASDIDAFRDVVGDDGVLVPPGDAKYLGDTISDLLGQPEQTRELGQRAREAARRFDWSVVIEAYRDVYRDAVDRGGSTIQG